MLNMNFKQSKFISPLIFMAFSLNLTQYPLSIRDTFLSHSISKFKLDLLQQQYNLKSDLLIRNNKFFKIILGCLDDKPHKELKAQLPLFISKEIAHIHKAYMDMKHDFTTFICELLETNKEKFQFTKGLRDKTIYKFKLLLTLIFPILKRV
jgi:hypothetical protein